MNNEDKKPQQLLLKSPETGQEQAEQAAGIGPVPPDNTGEIQGRDDSGRFKPGFSGNPTGRPQGAKNLRVRLKDGLAVLGAKDAQGNPLPLEEALTQKIIKMALDGDHKMIQLIMHYLEGKPTQPLDITSKGERLEGTMLVSDEADLRIDRIFGFRKLLTEKGVETEKKDHANNQRQPNGGDSPNHNGGGGLPQNGERRGAYEGTS